MSTNTIQDPILVCRGCLATTGEMKNMIEWNLVDDFYKITNIQINIDDEISELLCTKCEDVITKCKNFTAQCQQSDIFLKNIKKETKHIENNEAEEENTISCTIIDKNVIISITAPNMETKIYLLCPYCNEKYQKRSDLSNHLNKHRKDLTVDLRFYCSVKTCSYHKGNESKYFSGRKYLNQHIAKVHKNRAVACSNCSLNFANEGEYNRHLKTCNFIYICQICNKEFKANERLLVHLLRKHPELHKQYKMERKAEKRKQNAVASSKKIKMEDIDMCGSPKRSFATQTLMENIKNDVTLSWQPSETKKDEISTQTVFEDSLTQNEEDLIFFSETVSLSDIQTQTIPLEFGLSRSHKETITSQTQSPDLSIKQTQTCVCLSKPVKYDNFLNTFCTTSTETQTLGFDELLSVNSTETQTCVDDLNKDL